MNRIVINNLLRFILLVLLQVLLLNRINFYGYLNPYVYILFIMLLPFETPGWLLLLFAFITGLSIDIFSGTLGLHTAATVFLAFVRPAVIRLAGEKPEYDNTSQPTLREMGTKWFFGYAIVMTLAHHLVLNFVDVFSFAEFFQTLLRVLLSSVMTLVFIITLQYIFSAGKGK